MSTDYTEIAVLAQGLIDENGRLVTFNRRKQEAADPAKPWRGPGDPSAVPDATNEVRAVFVGVNRSTPALGLEFVSEELLKRAEECCLVGPTASFDLATADELVDGTTHWKIEFVQVLKPGDTVLLYAVGLKR